MTFLSKKCFSYNPPHLLDGTKNWIMRDLCPPHSLPLLQLEPNTIILKKKHVPSPPAKHYLKFLWYSLSFWICELNFGREENDGGRFMRSSTSPLVLEILKRGTDLENFWKPFKTPSRLFSEYNQQNLAWLHNILKQKTAKQKETHILLKGKIMKKQIPLTII